MSGDAYDVTIVRDDESTATVPVGSGETILDAAEAAAVDLRYGCREGRCSSCTGFLIEGSVEYVREPQALGDDHREDGFVLLCSAQPRADCRVRVGRTVLSAAFPSLWPGDGDRAALREQS
jgi:ferredoxin